MICNEIKTLLDTARNIFPGEKLVIYEFGVCEGEVFLDQIEDQDIDYYGFDSFEGLPAEADGEWCPDIHAQGKFDARIRFEVESAAEAVSLLYQRYRKSNIDITLIPKWFKNLSEEDIYLYGLKKPHIVHMDMDLYISCVEAWEFLLEHNLLRNGCIIKYDDWWDQEMVDKFDGPSVNVGENKAHTEIIHRYGLHISKPYKAMHRYLGRSR